MRLVEILNRANRAYPDWYLSEYFDEETGARLKGSGDTLAEFIVSELGETYDETASDEEQLAEARRVLERARGRLAGCIEALT